MILNLEKIGKRLRTKEKIKATDGNEYIIDFTYGRNFEIVNGKIKENGFNKLYADFYRYDEQGCWGNATFENIIFKNDFTFKDTDIIKAINLISEKKFTDLYIFD